MFNNIKNLKCYGKIINNHKNAMNALCFFTFILFLPFTLVQLFADLLFNLLIQISLFRERLVYFLFKLIYKNELIAFEKSSL